MAATDVKDVITEVKPNGETWIVKVLCNGTKIDVIRICGCGSNPDDPGNIPDPEPDSDVCRIANGLGSYIQGLGNLFATLLDEQPDNEFGSLQTAVSWMNTAYGTYLRGEWGAVLQLARDYNNTDSTILSDRIPTMGEYLACAAYAAITSDPNGIDLSPTFAEGYSEALSEFIPTTANSGLIYAFGFMSQVINLIPLSAWKREALEASAIDPSEAGDYDCDCGFAFPEDVCAGVHWQWTLVDNTPSGFSVPTGTPAALIPAFRQQNIDLGASEALVDGWTNQVSRNSFDHWKCPNFPGGSVVTAFMMVVYEFSDACTLTEAHMRVATGTDNSKRAGIYYQLDGQNDPEDWQQYAFGWTGWQGGFLQTGAQQTVNNVKRVAFCGAYGGGLLFMNETAINGNLV